LILAGGSAGVVGTLWPVYDMRAALLMLRFYSYLFDEGRGPIQSLSLAQSWLVRSTRLEKLKFLIESENTLKRDDIPADISELVHRRIAEMKSELKKGRERNDYAFDPSTSAAFTITGL
jgi:CHAT domain-containing protein